MSVSSMADDVLSLQYRGLPKRDKMRTNSAESDKTSAERRDIGTTLDEKAALSAS